MVSFLPLTMASQGLSDHASSDITNIVSEPLPEGPNLQLSRYHRSDPPAASNPTIPPEIQAHTLAPHPPDSEIQLHFSFPTTSHHSVSSIHSSSQRNESIVNQPPPTLPRHQIVEPVDGSSSQHSAYSHPINNARSQRRKTQYHQIQQRDSPHESQPSSVHSGLTSRPPSILEEAISAITKKQNKLEHVLFQQQLTLENLLSSMTAFRASHEKILKQQNQILNQQL